MVHTSPPHRGLPLQWRIRYRVELPVSHLSKDQVLAESQEQRQIEPSGSLPVPADL